MHGSTMVLSLLSFSKGSDVLIRMQAFEEPTVSTSPSCNIDICSSVSNNFADVNIDGLYSLHERHPQLMDCIA